MFFIIFYIFLVWMKDFVFFFVWFVDLWELELCVVWVCVKFWCVFDCLWEWWEGVLFVEVFSRTSREEKVSSRVLLFIYLMCWIMKMFEEIYILILFLKICLSVDRVMLWWVVILLIVEVICFWSVIVFLFGKTRKSFKSVVVFLFILYVFDFIVWSFWVVDFKFVVLCFILIFVVFVVFVKRWIFSFVVLASSVSVLFLCMYVLKSVFLFCNFLSVDCYSNVFGFGSVSVRNVSVFAVAFVGFFRIVFITRLFVILKNLFLFFCVCLVNVLVCVIVVLVILFICFFVVLIVFVIVNVVFEFVWFICLFSVVCVFDVLLMMFCVCLINLFIDVGSFIVFFVFVMCVLLWWVVLMNGLYFVMCGGYGWNFSVDVVWCEMWG